MSESLNLNEIRENAFRLMEKKDYTGALNNWKYIEKNSKDFDSIVSLNTGKWLENLDSVNEASKVYSTAISHLAENSEEMDYKIFIELLFSYGEVELKRRNYTSAIDSFNSFIAFVQK